MEHASETPLRKRTTVKVHMACCWRRDSALSGGIPSLRRVGMLCRILGLLGLTVLIAAPPAAATSFLTSLLTRFTELSVVDGYELISHGKRGDRNADSRYVEGTRLDHDEVGLWLDTNIYWRPDANVVVLARRHVTGSCGVRYQFILVTPEGNARASNKSKSCSWYTIAMRVSHEEIELDVEIPNRPDLVHLTIRFDGESLQEIEVPRDDSGAEIAGAGKDVTRWVGVHPAALLDDSSERRRFETIMRREELYELVSHMYLAFDYAKLAGDFLVAQGCKPQDSGPSQAAIAIEVTTGRPFAIIYSPEGRGQGFSAVRSPMHQSRCDKSPRNGFNEFAMAFAGLLHGVGPVPGLSRTRWSNIEGKSKSAMH